jgi:hypothetical protein
MYLSVGKTGKWNSWGTCSDQGSYNLYSMPSLVFTKCKTWFGMKHIFQHAFIEMLKYGRGACTHLAFQLQSCLWIIIWAARGVIWEYMASAP